MLKVLAIVDWYLPGFKAGGPIRTVSNLVELLGKEFEFFILTRDRDLKDKSSYPDVPLECWVGVGRAKVLYTDDLSLRNLRKRIQDVQPDIIYFNSFFSRITRRILVLRRLRLLTRCAFVAAPRGEFSPGALAMKSLQKKVYLKTTFALGFYRDISWHASTEMEKQQILSVVGKYGDTLDQRESSHNVRVAINVAADIPRYEPEEIVKRRMRKSPGSTRFIFISRVSPMKNLLQAVDIVSTLKGQVQFDIYGPAEDRKYWAECERHIAGAPQNVTIRYRGFLSPDEIQATISKYHFFILPTFGENFGHAIFESLSAGCPAVISDRTPWPTLQDHGVGWSLPLADTNAWQETLQACVDMDETTYAHRSRAASAFAREWFHSPAIREDNFNLFAKALSPQSV